MPGFHTPESENPHSGAKANAGKSLVETGSPPRDLDTSSLPFEKFREIDANHDGKINFDELSNYIENFPARNFGPQAAELAARNAYEALFLLANPRSLETDINKMTLSEGQAAGLLPYMPHDSKGVTFASFAPAYKQHEMFACQGRASWLIKKANANGGGDAGRVNREDAGIDKDGTINMQQFLSIYGERDVQQ